MYHSLLRVWFFFATSVCLTIPGVVVYSEPSSDSANVSSNPSLQTPEEIKKYWTPERMNNAKPAQIQLKRDSTEPVLPSKKKSCYHGTDLQSEHSAKGE